MINNRNRDTDNYKPCPPVETKFSFKIKPEKTTSEICRHRT